MGRLRSAKAGAFLSLCLGSACGGATTPATPQPSTGPSAGPPGTIQVSGATPSPMRTQLGQNYWCWSNFGNLVRGTEGLVSSLHLGVLRAGGHNNDTNTSDGFYPFDESRVDDFVAYCRRIGRRRAVLQRLQRLQRSDETRRLTDLDPRPELSWKYFPQTGSNDWLTPPVRCDWAQRSFCPRSATNPSASESRHQMLSCSPATSR
jgi:hypothetical protein